MDWATIKDFVNWATIKDIVTIILALLAIGLSIFHIYRLSRTHHHNVDFARKTDAALSLINESVSTRYLGEFPVFLADLNRMLESATKSITMFYDVPAYAYFSDHQRWLHFDATIRIKNDSHVTIKMLFYDKSRRKAALRDQYFQAGQDGWRTWLNEGETKVKMEAFLRLFHRAGEQAIAAETIEFDKFLELLENVQARAAADFVPICREQLGPIEVKAPFRIHAWIVDGREAVFAVPSYFSKHSEYGFITRDRGLIQALEAMFEKMESQTSEEAGGRGHSTC